MYMACTIVVKLYYLSNHLVYMWHLRQMKESCLWRCPDREIPLYNNYIIYG